MLFYLDRTAGIIFISCLFVISIITEVSRLLVPGINRLFYVYFKPLLRAEEENIPTGTVYYLGGVLLSLLLFDKDIVLFSLTILAIGDPAASTIGKNWGKHRIKGKSLEGSAAFFLTAMTAGLLFQFVWPGLTIGLIMMGALAGAIAELLSTTKLNDNLLVPITAAGTMTALSFLINLLKFN